MSHPELRGIDGDYRVEVNDSALESSRVLTSRTCSRLRSLAFGADVAPPKSPGAFMSDRRRFLGTTVLGGAGLADGSRGGGPLRFFA